MIARRLIIIVAFVGAVALTSAALAEEVGTRPLILTESINIALENNRQIHAAWQEVLAARASVRETRTAFFPQLSAQASYTKLEEVPSTSFEMAPPFGTQTMEMGKDEVYDQKATLTQPLYAGGAIYHAYKGAGSKLAAAQSRYDQICQKLICDVRESYFNLLKAQKLTLVCSQAVRQIQAHLKVVQDYYDVGIVPRNDLLTAQVRLANAGQDLIEAQNRVKLARSVFNNTLGWGVEREVQIVPVESFEPLKLDLEDSTRRAYQNRPELEEAKANVAFGQRSVKLAKSGYRPTISLHGEYDRQKGASTSPDEYWENWTGMVVAQMNIWDWGATRNKVKQARAGFEGLKDSQILLKGAIALEVMEAYLRLNESQEKMKVMAKSIEQAQENLRIMEEKYRAQAATTTEVLDAQTLLTGAQTSYFQTLYDCHIAKARLDKAMGEGGGRL